MKKILLLAVLVVQFTLSFSQVIPLEVQEELNYQEVQIFAKTEFSIIESMPKYPNGMDGINQHIWDNLQYPEEAWKNKIEGVVLVSLVIGVDGYIESTKIVQSVHSLLDNEAIRVIELMEKWEPAWQRGKPVRTAFVQPFNFKL